MSWCDPEMRTFDCGVPSCLPCLKHRTLSIGEVGSDAWKKETYAYLRASVDAIVRYARQNPSFTASGEILISTLVVWAMEIYKQGQEEAKKL